MALYAEEGGQLLFCENETNNERLFGVPNTSAHPKDAIGDHVVGGAPLDDRRRARRAPSTTCSRSPRAGARRSAAPDRRRDQDPARARLRRGVQDAPGGGRRVLRDGHPRRRSTPITGRSCASRWPGLLWSKQYYEYDVHRWLREHGVNPWGPEAATTPVRNVAWFHMVAGDIISMPDKWEYPWFAAWDLAFHCAPLSLVDVDFAKEQVELLLRTRYMHPNGQIPAYEWNFSDVNPPVTAWAALYVYEREAEIRGKGDRRVPPARLPAAADQLHLVGEPQGPRRAQPLPGRLPRAGQHRDLRPLGAAAGRRDAGPGGRHRLDGAVLPVDAPDRDRARARRRRLRRHGAEVHLALRVDRDRAQPAGGRHAAVGRAGRLLLRRDADARRRQLPAEGALARRPAAAVRGDGVRRRDGRSPPRC